jgi:pilus assembly protein CpaE
VTQIAIISHDERFVEQVHACGATPIRYTLADFDKFAKAPEAPRSVIVDIRGSVLPASLSAYCKQHPTSRVAIVMKSLDPTLMLEAMRAGVTECIAEPITGHVLEEALDRLRVEDASEPAGQVYAFVGAKGGVGTSTLAVNTAVSLARVHNADALLIDLHAGYGEDALLLGSEPRFSVVDALENVDKVDSSFFSGIIEKTTARVHLLGGGTKPMRGATDEARVRVLIEAAARTYRTTVLDVPRFDAAILNTLDAATKLVVVTTQELGSLRAAGQVAEQLRQRYGSGRVQVVLNRADRLSMISHADVERAAGSSVKQLIPSCYREAIEALNSGRPPALEPNSRLGTAFQTLARDLAGIAKERTERQSGVLTRLVLRRA